ncbi:RNA-binding motif protein, X-linked 2-like [Lineus longissimus]|uniref:RNA-binding motif protein, X-linked 2-like n=1 Tax=Lineus longissimus TaxID=88925 RepID=UPI002B4D7E40
MNPLSNVKGTQRINDRELELGLTGSKKSWHDKYKDSAWIFIGGLPYDLTEGDTICIFSQYGEIVNINLVRDQKTGKSKGFAFICYEDQRSTILSVDNLNGAKVLGRTLRVDHVEKYKVPQEKEDRPVDAITLRLREEGCAPKLPDSEPESELEEEKFQTKVKEEPKEEKSRKKKSKKKKKKMDKYSDSDSESDDSEKRWRKKKKSSKTRDLSESSDSLREKKRTGDFKPLGLKIKTEKVDPGYEKYSKGVNSRDGDVRDKRRGKDDSDYDSRGGRYGRDERDDIDRRGAARDRGRGNGRDRYDIERGRSGSRERGRRSRSRSRDWSRRSRSRERYRRDRSRSSSSGKYPRKRSRSSSGERYRSKDRKRYRSRDRR